MHYAVALDLETTGLLDGSTEDFNFQPGIVEIGAVRVELPAWEWEREMGLLINPEKPFEAKAKEITGITEDLSLEPNLPAAFNLVADLFVGAHYLITFNGLGFDVKVLQHQLKRYGLETRFPWPPHHLDLMHISKDILNLQGRQGNKWPKLDELCEHCGIDRTTKHRALEDAVDTVKCAQHLHSKGQLIGMQL